MLHCILSIFNRLAESYGDYSGSYGFYDSKRSFGFVLFFVFTTRRGVLVSCGFINRLAESYGDYSGSYGFFFFLSFSSPKIWSVLFTPQN